MFDLGVNLRELRRSRKWTQKRLAEMLNVSEASISKYESNLAAPPIEILRGYAALFKVSMDELLGNQSKGVVSLQGLTDEQASVIQELADLFKQENINSENIPIRAYAVLGKIAMEMQKLN